MARAAVFLFDSLAVGIAGAGHPQATALRQAVQGWGVLADGATNGAHVWGQTDKADAGLRLPAPSAAFLNGFQIHCHEYDCVHEPAVVHPMATILAALMAAAEARALSGQGPVRSEAFLAALVLAIDVAVCLGMAATSPLKFFRPANAGIFAASLGVARLRGFDAERAQHVLGYALAFCAGTMQAHTEGKPALPLQIAYAARNALIACDMVEAGFEGSQAALTGPFGYFALFETSHDLAVFDSLGTIWRVLEVSHKPFPTGRAAQGGIPLMLKAKATGVAAEDVASVKLLAPPLIARLVGRRPFSGQSASHARLCFAYCAAVALQRGRVSLSDFDAASLADPALQALAARIEVEAVPNPDPAAFAPQQVVITLCSGEVMSFQTQALYGSPADPMLEDDRAAKFAACCAYGFGATPLRARAVEAALGAALSLTQGGLLLCDDVGTLSRLAAGLDC
jgi:2-methylcitrate dehydratase PrpD